MIGRVFIQLFAIGTAWAGFSCVSVQPPRSLAAAPPALAHRPEAPASDTQTADPGPDPSPIPSPDQGPDLAPDPGADRWPTRWGVPGSPRGVVVECEHPAGALRAAHLGRFHRLRVGSTEYRHAEALGQAVGITEGFRFEPEGPGSMVFQAPVERRDADQPDKPGRDDPFETTVFVSGRVVGQTDGQDRVALERTWIATYDALTPEPAGTIVFIPGMLGTPEPIIEGMIRYWRRAGYTVVRLLSHPSRFTERIETEVAPGDEPVVGVSLAAVFDERMAECAYACDAALDRVFEQRPVLSGKPVVLIGMSGGAIVLPTVAAYAPERYHAAVMIAGGVDFLSISATSNYAEWIDAVEIDWEPGDPDSAGKPAPERLALLSESYLGASKLDPMHTAPEMGVSALLLHASGDKAVPAALGDKLWNRLGQPERWVFPVGHELIFVMLPMQADRLQRWIDGAVEAPAAP